MGAPYVPVATAGTETDAKRIGDDLRRHGGCKRYSVHAYGINVTRYTVKVPRSSATACMYLLDNRVVRL